MRNTNEKEKDAKIPGYTSIHTTVALYRWLPILVINNLCEREVHLLSIFIVISW